VKPGLTPVLGSFEGVAAAQHCLQRFCCSLPPSGTGPTGIWRYWQGPPATVTGARSSQDLRIHLLLAGLGCFGFGAFT